MTDQATEAVDVNEFFATMDSEDEQPDVEEAVNDEPQDANDEEAEEELDAEAEEDSESDESEEEEGVKPEVVVSVEILDENGNKEVKSLSIQELADGYQSKQAFTRLRQQDAEEKRALHGQFVQEITQEKTRNAETIGQLQTLVYQLVAPELTQLTPELAMTDPSAYVALKAKAEQVNGFLTALDQQKMQNFAQSQQILDQQKQQELARQREYVNKVIPTFGNAEYQKNLISFTSDAYGIPSEELAFLTNAPAFKDGGFLDSGKAIQILDDAMKWRNLQKQKPMTQQKLANAQKAIKPSAPQPKNSTKDLLSRAKKGDKSAVDGFFASL